MHVADLEQMFDYNYWANKQLLRAVSTLTDEQFTESVAGSYGSVRNTLVHVLSAEWGWLERSGGLARGAKLKAEDYPTVASLASTWDRIEEHMRAFVSGLTDADLARDIEFALDSGPRQSRTLGSILWHSAVHAVHHRGQVSLLLRELGVVPGNFDLVIYAGEQWRRPA